MKRLLVLSLALLAAGCGTDAPRTGEVARVGQQTLTGEELSALLARAVPGQDTTALRKALIEQWVADALLYEAARREGLLDDAELQHQIEQNRRAIVVSAFIEHYLDENPPTFTDDVVAAYYEQNVDRLPLLEPYVQFRLFGSPSEDDARRARQAVTRRISEPDTLWQQYRRRPGFVVVMDSAGPERGLYAELPEVRDALLSLSDGQTSGVIAGDSLYYVVHVVRRIAAGEQAPLAWVRPEIEHRLTLDQRKQMVRRLVQTLRSEALARGMLTMPDTLAQ